MQMREDLNQGDHETAKNLINFIISEKKQIE